MFSSSELKGRERWVYLEIKPEWFCFLGEKGNWAIITQWQQENLRWEAKKGMVHVSKEGYWRVLTLKYIWKLWIYNKSTKESIHFFSHVKAGLKTDFHIHSGLRIVGCETKSRGKGYFFKNASLLIFLYYIYIIFFLLLFFYFPLSPLALRGKGFWNNLKD